MIKFENSNINLSMQKFLTFFCVIFSFICCNLFFNAQRTKIDGLKFKNNKEKIQYYRSYLEANETKDFINNIKISTVAIELSSKEKDDFSKAIFLRLKGKSYYLSGKLDSANVYYFQSYTILEKQHLSLQTAKLCMDIGQLNRKLKNYSKSLVYYNKAFEMYKQMKNEEGLATVYNESGVVFEYMGNYDEAINRYKKSLEIQQKRNDFVGQGYALEFIGGVLILEKKYPLAEKYLLESLEIRKKTKDNFAIALNYNVLGNLYINQKKYNLAEHFFVLSNTIAKQSNYLDLEKQNLESLSQLYKLTGKYEQAYNKLEQSKKLNDSIFNINKLKQIEEISTQYETAKKDKEILANKSKLLKRNIAVFSLLGLLLLTFLLFRIRQHRQNAKHQKKLMLQQDLSAKAVIDAEDNERKRMANHLHDGVGQLLAATNLNLQVLEELKTDNNKFDKVMLKTQNILHEAMAEVRTLSHQIMPNTLMKNSLSVALKELIDKTNSSKLNINLSIEGLQEKLNDAIEIVMYRVIQECINNIIKHADASEITIKIQQNNQKISAEIIDNGKGFDVQKKNQQNNGGIGLENMKSRIEFLKGTYHLQSTIGQGTKVQILIPINHE